MPKLKTNRSAAKRFYKITSKGKIKSARGGKSHLNEKKSRKRVNRLSEGYYLEGHAVTRIRKYVPYL